VIRVRSRKVNQTFEVGVHHDAITKVAPLFMGVRCDVLGGSNAAHDRTPMLSVECNDITSSHLLTIAISHASEETGAQTTGAQSRLLRHDFAVF
jgi:hypothetical protein